MTGALLSSCRSCGILWQRAPLLTPMMSPVLGTPHSLPSTQPAAGGADPELTLSCSGAALTPGQAPGREATALVL